MAKSKSFFGLRRGSTKSHTYQVLRGEQITKDRVYDVTNPQSEGQMKQRLKLPIVSTSLTVLKELVNHSFEGVSYGDDTLRVFRQENLKSKGLEITEYVPKGVTDTGVANIMVSKGTLTRQLVAAQSSRKRVSYYVPIADDAEAYTIPAAISAGAPIPSALAKWLFSFLSIDTNSQLTFLVSYEGSPYDFAINSSDTAQGHYHKWVVSRIIGDESKLSAWKVKNALKASADSEDSQEIVLTDGYIDITIPDGMNPETVDGGIEDQSYQEIDISLTSGKDMCAATVIRSEKENDTWKRSEQRMVPLVKSTTMSYENVVYGYMNNTNVLRSSKYLNTGTEGVGITGGTL